MEKMGSVENRFKKRHKAHRGLPNVTIVETGHKTLDGDILVIPTGWSKKNYGPLPEIFLAAPATKTYAPRVGDRFLVRLRRISKNTYEAKIIRPINISSEEILGVIKNIKPDKWLLQPIEKKLKSCIEIAQSNTMDAKTGQLVRVKILANHKSGVKAAKVIEKFPVENIENQIGLISIHQHAIPSSFSRETINEAKKVKPATPEGRIDLRLKPFVTIDDHDAKDFDDAIFAEVDKNPNNIGGYQIFVAIADVSWYVRLGSALDISAYERGNSVYLPDMVIPMLPETLSNGVCSLLPKKDRPCLTVKLWIDRKGNLINHQFARTLIRSAARLTYQQVQSAHDGNPDKVTKKLLKNVIHPIYAAYKLLKSNRKKRGALEITHPEPKIIFDENGRIQSIKTRTTLESHKLIEEFMVTANIAAADSLEKKGVSCIYRIHEKPSKEKLHTLNQVLDTLGVKLSQKKGVTPTIFNEILSRIEKPPLKKLVSTWILRSQSKAEYSKSNIGHFGLSLERYCHFTSPIRRYSDLLIHHALISYLDRSTNSNRLEKLLATNIGEHLSSLERRAITAERDTIDRYSAHYLESQIGKIVKGHISGAGKFGLFVAIDDINVDGFIPISTLTIDYFDFDENLHQLVGRSTDQKFQIGDDIDVRLIEANPITGGILLEPIYKTIYLNKAKTKSRRSSRKKTRKRKYSAII